MSECQNAPVCSDYPSSCCSSKRVSVGSMFGSSRHVPRVIITGRTRELIVNIGSIHFDNIESGIQDRFSLVIKRRRCDSTDEAVLNSYAVGDSGDVHFFMSGEFISDPVKFKKGFYDAKIMLGDCHIDDIEIIKATSFFAVSSHEVHRTECFDTDNDWVEPACENEPGSCCVDNDDRRCSDTKGDGCPDCHNDVVVEEHNMIDGYAPVGDDEFSPPASHTGEEIVFSPGNEIHTTKKRPTIQKGILIQD